MNLDIDKFIDILCILVDLSLLILCLIAITLILGMVVA